MSTTIREGNHPWKLKQSAGGITSALKQIAENKKEDGKPCWESRSEESEHVPDGISKLLQWNTSISKAHVFNSLLWYFAAIKLYPLLPCDGLSTGPSYVWCQFAKRKTEGFPIAVGGIRLPALPGFVEACVRCE